MNYSGAPEAHFQTINHSLAVGLDIWYQELLNLYNYILRRNLDTSLPPLPNIGGEKKLVEIFLDFSVGKH